MAAIDQYIVEPAKGDFESLVNNIQSTSNALQEDARLVINRNVTARAWLTGFYIVEYEQQGNDRAKYGEGLLKRLAEPVVRYLSVKSGKSQSVISLLQSFGNFDVIKSQSLISQLPLHQSATVSGDGFAMMTTEGEVMPVPQMLFNRLSFTHISKLIHIGDRMKRSFYALEAMRGPWSVRELQRQIDSNYYERSGWSKKPELLASKVTERAERPTFREELKSHYIFEFLGLAAKNVIEEDELEQALIDHLEEFLLELGMGFCLEARQKKLLIDDRYFKTDLVFYHRILRCHCLVELKAHRLDYADMAQLNMYLEYYRRHYMRPDDNPPIGLLLCTKYGQEMVEYVVPNTDPHLFVAQDELQLPSKEKMKDFLMRENRC